VNKSEAAGGVLVFLFGALTAYLSLRMPIGSFRAAGPGLFPLCLGALLMMLSALFVVKTMSGVSDPKAGSRPIMVKAGAKRPLLFTGAVVVSVLLIQPLGYPLSSFLLLLFLLRILGVRPWYFNVLLSFSAALVCYFLFVQWLMIPLPKGWIGV